MTNGSPGFHLFIDVDGTLLTYENRLPDSAAAAVRAARAAGHRVYLCTGRSRAEVPDQLWDLGVDGLIGGNGSYIELAGTVLHHDHLSREQTRAITNWLTQLGRVFYLEANSGLFGSPGFIEVVRPVIRQYAALKGATDSATLEPEEAFHGLVMGGDLDRDDVNKISYVISDPADPARAAAAFPELKTGTWGGRGSDALFGDLAAPGTHKAAAMGMVLSHFGVDASQAVAFGDAAIDADIIEAAGIGVALGNSPADLKAIADLVAPDVEDDGLASAFVTLGLVPANAV